MAVSFKPYLHSTQEKIDCGLLNCKTRIIRRYTPKNALIKITPLEREDAIELIKSPVRDIYKYSNEAIEYILEYSNRVPYYIQMFCRYAMWKGLFLNPPYYVHILLRNVLNIQ